MTIPSSLKNLTDVLEIRKRQQGEVYNLLLTSTISLTPGVIRQICTAESWTTFCNYFHKIGVESDDRIKLLTEHLGIHNNLDGYRALAHLIINGYFSTILTTNLDSTLEDALQEAGLPPTAFQTFIVGRDQDEYIARVLGGHPSGICVIKLHGSLREKVLPRQFPNFFDHPAILRESLGYYLNQDIVIVGSVERDEDIIRLVNANKKKRIYYANVRKSSRDTIIRLIEARGGSVHASLISGAYGEFTPLFRMLVSTLLHNASFQHMAQPDPSMLRYGVDVVDGSSVYKEDVVGGNGKYCADVLLVTVTEVEANAVLDCCVGSKLCFIDERVYYDLGVIGGARIFMVQSEMGSDGQGGSRFTVEEGIRALSPSAVVMVGIAFGIDEEKHPIGDILVSRQLRAYEPQRIGSDSDGKQTINMRGDRITAPIWLLDRFKAGLKTWREPPYIHFGLILSGAKLIAHQDYRDQLHQIEEEAIGGEMEGVGMYETAQRYNVGWLLVKAVCDWADSNKHQDKEKRQKEAAKNAARFTIHVIEQGGFRRLHASKHTAKVKAPNSDL